MKTDFEYLRDAVQEMHKGGMIDTKLYHTLVFWVSAALGMKDKDSEEENRRHDEIINEIHGTPGL